MTEGIRRARSGSPAGCGWHLDVSNDKQLVGEVASWRAGAP